MYPIKSYFQSFDNIMFSSVYPDFDKFLEDYNNLGFPKIFLDDNNLKLLYCLLIARFANSTIKNYDTNQFRFQVFSTVWRFGGTWEKEVDIQKALRELSLDNDSDIYQGSRIIQNNALNPGTTANVSTDFANSGELNFTNNQTVTKQKKSRIEGLSLLSDMLKRDVTESFLTQFDKLFKTIIYTGRTLYYTTNVEEDE